MVSLSELKDVNFDGDMRNLKMIKLRMASVQEAKNRATVLALLTCNMRKSNNSFVRFFQPQDFIYRNEAKASYANIRRLWRDNGIFDDDVKTLLQHSQTTLCQQHGGLVRKRENPYMTLLRARPREKKTHFES